jgi:hypothetical protein
MTVRVRVSSHLRVLDPTGASSGFFLHPRVEPTLDSRRTEFGCGFCFSPTCALCRYPADRVLLCTRLKRSAPRLQIRSRCQRALSPPCAPRHRAHHLVEEGFGVATCPMAQSAPPTRKGLLCCHVPRGTEPVTRQERAPELSHTSRLQARSLRRKALASPRDRGTRTTAQ